jgi:Putative beta-barrel porin-2, OmpL-like. bbp2
MRGKKLDWLLAVALSMGMLPRLVGAADKSLEDRVRALEKKVDQQRQSGEPQSVQQRIDAIEKEVKDSEKSIADKLGVEIHGFVAGDYAYNFNAPDSRTSQMRVFDNDANSFTLNQANLHVQRTKPDGIGFVTDLDFGKTAQVVSGTTRWSNAAPASNNIDLRQAYITYGIADTPFSLQAGKFVTLHGAEVIKSYNNFNYNISNSMLFGFAIPFTHTGLLGTYTLPSDWGSVQAGIVNGWDNVVDNNDGKSLHSMVTLNPSSMVSFAVGVTYGAEQNSNATSKRLMVSPLLTIKPTDQLTFVIDYNYGNESNIKLACTPDPTGECNSSLGNASIVRAGGNVMWQGVAGYIVYALNDQWQLALRGEVFDDPDGVRTLFQQAGHGPGATFWEVTPTVAYKIVDGLTWRAEYRHDESDRRFFDKGSRGQGSPNGLGQTGQDTLGTELIYAF